MSLQSRNSSHLSANLPQVSATRPHPHASGGVRRIGPTYRDLPTTISHPRVSGFTLIEVMVALLVITLGMGAVIVTTGESAWKSSYLRESTIASWVAYNEIALYRAKRTWSEATSRSGEAEMANTQWDWKMKISATDDPSLRRVEVEVFIQGETAVKSRVTGFIAKL